MAITATWKIDQMIRNTSDGGVVTVLWQCEYRDEDTNMFSLDGGKLMCEPDPNAAGFIAFDSLTETDVLGWVYNSLIDGNIENETADEAKTRVETARKAALTAKIAKKTSRTTGVPWSTDIPAGDDG